MALKQRLWDGLSASCFQGWGLEANWLKRTVICGCGLQGSSWGRFRSSESRKRPRNGSPQEMMWPPSCHDASLWSTATQRRSRNLRTRIGLTERGRGRGRAQPSPGHLTAAKQKQGNHIAVSRTIGHRRSVSLFNLNWLPLTQSFYSFSQNVKKKNVWIDVFLLRLTGVNSLAANAL